MSSTSSVGSSLFAGSQATSTSGGLGAGIDVSALVAAAMANQTAGLTLLQNQQSSLTTQQNALNSFSSDLQKLSDAVFALTDPAGPLTDIAAISSDQTVLTASAVSGAATGNYAVVVSNLATTSSAYSAPVASSSTPLATGSLQVQVGSNAPVTIQITSANNTLAGLAQSINNGNAGVTASVINDASGARLAIVSDSSGAPGDLTITPSAGSLTFTKAVIGTNASLTVNGIPISSASNTITGAVSGLTLNLNSANPNETVNVRTSSDVTQQESSINNFVSAYNAVIQDFNAQFSVNGASGQPGPLQADSTLSLAQSQLLGSISFAMTGNGNINTLADLGITMNNDGTLTVNNGTLSSSLQNNSTAVQDFFQATKAGAFGDNLNSQINAIENPVNGTVARDITGLQQTQTSLTQQITDLQSRLLDTQQQLTRQFDQVNVVLQQLPLLLGQINSQLSSLGK